MTVKNPIPEDIRRKIERCAYHIWEREGQPHGREHEHWRMAEAEILGAKPVKKAEPAKTVSAKPAKAKTPNGTAKAQPVTAKTPVAAKPAAAAKSKKPGKPKSPK